MKTTTAYELELHNAQYIEEKLSGLHLPVIEMSVPSLGETMLINAAKMPESRPIVVEVEAPGEKLTMYRTDMRIEDQANMPIQIMEADPRKANVGHELFATAVASLTYVRTGKYTWDVNVDASNINDTHMFREFTGILTSFAYMKQRAIKENS